MVLVGKYNVGAWGGRWNSYYWLTLRCPKTNLGFSVNKKWCGCDLDEGMGVQCREHQEILGHS